MPPTRVAIAGLGAIGRVLARKLAEGVPGLTLACAAAGNHAKAQDWLAAEGITCRLVEPEAFPTHADLAIECAPASVLDTHLPADARGGKAGHGALGRRAAPAAAVD